jgi:mRNA-degrading endonuclease HigB of HigAB toxin-antitoxin module
MTSNDNFKIKLNGIEKEYKFGVRFKNRKRLYIKIEQGKHNVISEIPLLTCMQQDTGHFFNLLFIQITIESILEELKNRYDLHCFFYMDRETLENIGKEHVQIITNHFVLEMISCLRYYIRKLKNHSEYADELEYPDSVFKIKIETLNRSSVFVDIL